MLDKFECSISRLPFALSLFLRLGENSFFRRCLFSLFFSLYLCRLVVTEEKSQSLNKFFIESAVERRAKVSGRY